jgi:hypothetical protein
MKKSIFIIQLISILVTGCSSIEPLLENQSTQKVSNMSAMLSTVVVSGVTVNPNKAAILVNATAQLTASVLPVNATNPKVIWTSSNLLIATVSIDGLVTGNAVGTATISATTVDGAKVATSSLTVYSPGGFRDVLTRPFASNSIWNTPIGSNAVYVPAGIQPPSQMGMTADEDIIVLSANSPLVDVRICNTGWDQTKSRCTLEAGTVFSTQVPIPSNFIVSLQNDQIPNSCATILMPDGITIRQTQPFARCIAGGPASALYNYIADQSIKGDGRIGIHGGSGLSALGGTIRIGELKSTSGPINHALKINVYAGLNLFYNSATGGYRWPASWADSYANDPILGYGKASGANPVQACRMGALLALAPSIDINNMGLITEPAKKIAQVLQDYGAYIVDDTAWNVYAIETEWSPNGKVTSNFEYDWGFPMVDGSLASNWALDMKNIYTKLSVVDNNSATSIGGGGIPRIPLAPALP